MDNRKKENEVFTEKIDNIEIKDIINIFYSRDSESLISKENQLFLNFHSKRLEKMGFSLELCKNLFGTKNYVSINIKYKDEDIPNYFKIIEIEDLNGEKETHHIYRYQYCLDLITKEKNLKIK
jgi:hypothetical protein